MCKIKFSGAVFFITAIAVVSVSSKSYAVPAFTRQVGVACSTCHFQHFPELNAFGRAFKSGGYTLTGGTTSLIEDDGLSLPGVLNAAFVIKFRYLKENGDDKLKDPSGYVLDSKGNRIDLPSNTGMLNFPDEASIFLAGRAGEHIGFITEWGQFGLANFRMPVGFEAGGGNLSIIPFTSEALGAQAGFELLNTGAVGNLRAFEDSERVMSAQRYIGTTDIDTGGEAEGVAVVYANNLGFVNATLWTPQHPGAGRDAPVRSWPYYLRAAITPTFGGWDFGAGFQYWGGTSETNNPDNKKDTKALGIDAQAQGEVGDMPLGVYVSYGKADATGGGNPNLFNQIQKGVNLSSSGNNSKTALSISAELGVLPNKLTLGLGYRIGNNGTIDTNGKDIGSDNAFSVAAIYKLSQNIQIGLTQTMLSGDAHNSANDATTPGDGVTAQTMVDVSASF